MSRDKMLVVYMTLGYPDNERYLEFMEEAVKNGADILEIGIPPKYAKYDGPVIRKSYEKVAGKFDLWSFLPETRKVIGEAKAVALTYLEDWASELDDFLYKLKGAGLDGVLFPDLLIDFVDDYRAYSSRVREKGLSNVIFTAPSVPDRMIMQVSRQSDLFLYYGVRPTTGIPLPITVSSLVTRVRNLVDNKLVVGFGLSDENDLRKALKAGADGAAIGTAFIQAIDNGGVKQAVDLVIKLRSILDEF